ncbi:MAG: ATP-binding cassette domain-containing protein, partial [Chloroflexota bacterium]|nr:ATP-binding cassette domain-containing protein [Chloroflexota bacterium]
MLEIWGLVAGYGKYKVLREIDLNIKENEIVGLFGPNGAGKSTLLKAVFGVVPVQGGRIQFNGLDKTHFKPFQNTVAGLGFAPQEGNVFFGLTVEENLQLGGCCLGDKRQLSRRIEELVEVFPALRARYRLPARVLSGGERQMLAVAIALMSSPRVVLLDEPSSGLAPIMVEGLFDTIKRVSVELKTAVLLV